MTSELKPGEVVPAPEEGQQPSPQVEEQQPLEPAPPITAADVEAVKSDLEGKLAQAQATLRRVQGTSDANTARLERQITTLQSTLDLLIEGTLDPEKAKVFRAERIIEASKQTQQAPQPDIAAEQERFSSWSQSTLQREGIKWSSELQARFEQYASEDPTPAGWRGAVGLVIADVRKEEAKKAREEGARAVETERAKVRVANRQQEPVVDRGGASAPAATHKPLDEMTDAEFNEFVEKKNRDARARTRR